MKLRWRAPARGEVAAQKAAQDEPALQSKWTGGAELRAKGIRAGLWAGLVCGPVAVVLMVTGTLSPPPPAAHASAPIGVHSSGEDAAAGEFAQQFVVTWLQATRGQEKTLARFIAADGLELPDTAFIASEPATAGISTASNGVTTVVVAVSVQSTATSPAVRRYFQVPVVSTGSAPRAVTLPTPVAAPATGSDVGLGYPYRVPSGHPTTVAVQQFLGALLTGSADVSRYESPGVVLRPVLPPPYQSVKVTDELSTTDFTTDSGKPPADGARVQVLATTSLAVSNAQIVTAQYALTLLARAGRWEVAALDATPVLALPTARTSARSTTDTATPTDTTTAPTTTPANGGYPTTTPYVTSIPKPTPMAPPGPPAVP